MKGQLYDLLVGENNERKNVTKNICTDSDVPVFVAAPMVRYSK